MFYNHLKNVLLFIYCNNNYIYCIHKLIVFRAPDGTCILTNSEDNILRIFNLPHGLYEKCNWKEEDEMLPELHQAVIINEGGTIYDYSWYPCMSSIEPLTCW
jgi:hypothetical protein